MPEGCQYWYAYGNPLLYTDPDGEFFLSLFLGPLGAIIDAACWGAVIGGAGYTASVAFSDGGFDNWNWNDFGKSVGMGAISGAVTGGLGQMMGPIGGFGNEIARAGVHGFAQGTISQLSGGDFMTGFMSAGLSSVASSAFMMYGGSFANSTLGNYAFSGLAGGVGAELTGGNFWQGAAIGVMNAGLNHLQQSVTQNQQKKQIANIEDGIRKVLGDAEIGDEITGNDLQKNYGVPKNAAALINSFTVVDESSIKIDWNWKTKAGLGYMRFKNGTMHIENVYAEVFKRNVLYLTGGTIGIKDGSNMWWNIYLHRNDVSPNIKFNPNYGF